MKKILIAIFLFAVLAPSITLAGQTYVGCNDVVCCNAGSVNADGTCSSILPDPLVTCPGVKACRNAGAFINVCYEGLVPCGQGSPRTPARLWSVPGPGTNIVCSSGTPINITMTDPSGKNSATYPGVPCQICHLFVMLKAIIDFLVKLAFIIAVLMVVIAGVFFLFGGQNPANLNRAKAILKSLAYGLVMMLAAWVIVNLIFTMIGVADWTGLTTGWWKINCPIFLSQ